MKCTKTLLLSVMLLFATAMMGCTTKLKVLVRNSTTHEPIAGVKVRSFCPVYNPFKIFEHDRFSDDGITDKYGVVVLNLAEAELLFFEVYPFYNIEPDAKSDVYWEIRFRHPAISGNSNWIQLDPDDTRPYNHNLKITDPEVEIIIEKYIKSDEHEPCR